MTSPPTEEQAFGPDHDRALAFVRRWLSEPYDPDQDPEWLNLARAYAQFARVAADLEDAKTALAVVRESLRDQAQARIDPAMPVLSEATRKRLRREAEATYALAEDQADRVYAHALDLLSRWQERAALAKANPPSPV